MAKRLVAFLMVLVLGLSMVALSAQAGPVGPDCQHPNKTYKKTETYTFVDANQHRYTWRRVLVCTDCNEEISLEETGTELQGHAYKWKTGHIISTNTHYFRKVCTKCGKTFEDHEFYCTGKPHVTYPMD